MLTNLNSFAATAEGRVEVAVSQRCVGSNPKRTNDVFEILPTLTSKDGGTG
jgi:hypothetical protein